MEIKRITAKKASIGEIVNGTFVRRAVSRAATS